MQGIESLPQTQTTFDISNLDYLIHQNSWFELGWEHIRINIRVCDKDSIPLICTVLSSSCTVYTSSACNCTVGSKGKLLSIFSRCYKFIIYLICKLSFCWLTGLSGNY